MPEYLSPSPEETFEFGRRLAAHLDAGAVVALEGELGAGKTLLAGGICAGLGYEGAVTSPSFVHLHYYPNRPPIYHADWYRARDERDVLDLGLDEIIGSEAVLLIEWAQRFPALMPPTAWRIRIWWPPDANDKMRLIEVEPGASGAGWR